MERRKFIKNMAATTVGAIVMPTIVPSSVFGKNAPNNKIQIGQIGCGRIARDHDIAETIRYEQAQFVAVCDVDSKRLSEGKKYVDDFYSKKTGKSNYSNVKMYEDYRELLSNKDVDAVIISTPDHWHAQPAIEAALAKKDIYLQKPTSLTVAEGRLLSDIVRRQGVILQVGTQQRSSSQFRIAAELVRNGRIGKIHTVRIGLPGDPPGGNPKEMPIPPNLNYDMWLGSTPEVYYTEDRVHPQQGYGRPGWLRCEQFGAGMITGWGQHHIDSAAWGMDTEYTGPVSVQAVAEFPKWGLWDVHGDFMVKAEYENGITMYISNGYPNGIRYEGNEGWIFVSRELCRVVKRSGNPIQKRQSTGCQRSEDSHFRDKENEIHLYQSDNQHGNWLDCIQSRKEPISPLK